MSRKKIAWRVQSDDEGDFDELVVHQRGCKDALIHAEMMNKRDIFVSVGPISIWAHLCKDGSVLITGIEGVRDSDSAPTESKWPCFFCGSKQAHGVGFPQPGSLSTVPACANCEALHTL